LRGCGGGCRFGAAAVLSPIPVDLVCARCVRRQVIIKRKQDAREKEQKQAQKNLKKLLMTELRNKV
jgi:hypothetical protein